QVKDTEGDNYLGGKNIDYAIVDQILIPYLEKNNAMKSLVSKATTSKILRDGLKFYAEQAKNQLSSSDSCDITSQLDEFGVDEQGKEIELDLTITKDDLKPVVEPFFQRAIDICNNLLERNNIPKERVNSLILVGGPTHSPILRDMLREQVTPNVDTSIDPMTAVALGSALYASTIDYEEEIALPDSQNVLALDVSYESNSVADFEYVTIKPLPDESVGEIPPNLTVEVVRSDNAWSSGRVALEQSGIVLECFLLEGRPNSFTISVYDETGAQVNCFPKEISILQGTKIANAVLPYYIGIEVKDYDLDRDVFASLRGLEKNVVLPATGTIADLNVPKEIRPGHADEKLVIPIYQGEYDANGTSAIYNDPVFDVEITGEDVNSPVTANSRVDIKIKIDKSQMMMLEAFFYANKETVEKTIDVAKRKVITLKQLTEFLNEGRDRIADIRETYKITGEVVDEIEKNLRDIKKRYPSEKNFEDGRMHLLADMRRAFRAMEKIEKDHEWETLEPELSDVYAGIVSANNEILANRYDDTVKEVRSKYEEAKARKDGSEARRLLREFKQTLFDMTSVYQIAHFIVTCNEQFDPALWINPERAKSLLAQGAKIVKKGRFSREDLGDVVDGLIPLFIASTGDKAIKF
ncbi:MAG: Hsp70 family protein, partial [Desulfovibrionaceae bacterium]|nr:Hsp70 family protein [Desulfovibrionaceae bacterium]